MWYRTRVDLDNGNLNHCHAKVERHLSELRSCFVDSNYVESVLKDRDPLVYRVYRVIPATGSRNLEFGTSIVYPGRIGHEYFMTKGHFHEKEDAGEVYFCLKGEGYLILQSFDGQALYIRLKPGFAAYVPPKWWHRTVNTGEEPFICFYVVPADAGHNYTCLRKGDVKIVAMEVNGRPKILRRGGHS
ncbi:MAG: cupin domain-containing protein [Actinobacteria bacterium]|nr:cupin domain-containing protein [Actinomycetota bacterium]